MSKLKILVLLPLLLLTSIIKIPTYIVSSSSIKKKKYIQP